MRPEPKWLTVRIRVKACDREEKYESLKQEFAGMVWATSLPPTNAPMRSKRDAKACLVLEECRDLQEWTSCLESERLYHLQR